jgi:hypothetical protein
MSTILASTQAPLIQDYIRGDSRDIEVQINDSDGNPFDLTGCTVYITVNSSKTPSDDSGAALQTSTTSFSDPSSGLATLSLTNTLTQSINAGTYWYDIQLKDTSNNIVSLGSNKFIVKDDITTTS